MSSNSNIPLNPLEVPMDEGLKLLDTTVGLLLNGYVLSMIVYGFIFFQAYIYYNRFPHDHSTFKTVVALLIVMDTAAVAAITEALHFYIIVQFPDTFAGVNIATKTYCADNGLAVISILLAQLGYAHRTSQLGKGHKIMSVLAAGTAIGACVLGLIMTARFSWQPNFDLLAINPSKALVAVWQALTFISGAISFCQMCSWHKPPPSDEEKRGWLETSLDAFVSVGVDKGGVAALFQLGYVIAFLIAPDKRYWVPFHLVSRRLFIVSYLTLLNSRIVLRNGTGAYDSSSLPSSAVTRGPSVARTGMSIGTGIEFRTPSVSFKESRITAPMVSFEVRPTTDQEVERTEVEGKEQLIAE